MNIKFLVTIQKSCNTFFFKCLYLGIEIGMLVIDGEFSSLALIILLLQWLALGTLIYAVFFKILERERLKSNIEVLQ